MNENESSLSSIHHPVIQPVLPQPNHGPIVSLMVFDGLRVLLSIMH